MVRLLGKPRSARTSAEAVLVASLIGPGQVAGRILEWTVGRRLNLLFRARLASLLFPIGTVILAPGGPFAAVAFALTYGMSNGIMTINRGTLPLAIFGAQGYALMLGWLAVPVQLRILLTGVRGGGKQRLT